jgi:hypothetical protein
MAVCITIDAEPKGFILLFEKKNKYPCPIGHRSAHPDDSMSTPNNPEATATNVILGLACITIKRKN